MYYCPGTDQNVQPQIGADKEHIARRVEIHKSSQVKYRLLNERLQRLKRPQLTQPQLRPIIQGELNNLEETITVTNMRSKE